MYKRNLKKILLFCLVLLASVCLIGCDKKEQENIPLIGEWDYSGFVYTFNEDKTGLYSALDGETKKKFTYEIKDDNVIITYEGNNVGSKYKFDIIDNELHLTDTYDKEIVYFKK